MKLQNTLLLSAIALGGCGDACYMRNVSGTVTSTGSRMRSTERGSEQVIALRLNPYNADDVVVEVAAGADGLDIECESSRCSTLRENDCVRLTCMHNVRLFEPDIISCKMLHTVVCK